MTIDTMDLTMVSSAIRAIVESEYIDGPESREDRIARLAAQHEAEYQAEMSAWEVERQARINAWYAQGPVYSDPELFLFISGAPGHSRQLFSASSFDEARELIKGFPGWFGCNLFQLNEYRVTPEGLEWGPKASFFLNAVEEYYQDLRAMEIESGLS